jgi:outer membrane protein assembly factor BamB/TolB-like protein
MKRLSRIASVAILGLLLMPPGAPAAEGFRRLAVLDFENVSRDKTLDWIGVGIAETLSTELGRIQDLTLVERKRLNDALKEIKFGRSEAVDQATAQKMGKMLGADSVVVGSFQKFQDALRIQARVVDVETGTIRVPARVDGAYKDLFDLQIDLAKALVEQMKGSLGEADKRRLDAVPSRNVDALKAYAEGVYFYRNDLAQDAISEFDRALALDPSYADAHFYKGMALAKLKRWDEAITAFKRTVPRALPEQRVKWSWEAPFEAEGSARSVVQAFDPAALTFESVFSRAGPVRAQKRIVYAERRGADFVFHFVDLEKRSATRQALPIEANLFVAVATNRVTALMSATIASLFSGKVSIHGIDAIDGSVLWNDDVADIGGFPMFGVADHVVWEYFPSLRRLVARTEAALQPMWERNDLDLSWSVPPIRSTRSHGSVLIVKSTAQRRIRAIRLSDGQDAWTADLQADTSYEMVSDQALLVFEPDRRVFGLDFETGKQLFEVPVPQVAHARKLFMTASVVTVTALTHDNTLYFPSSADELVAVDLDRATPAERRTRWKVPLQKKVLTINAHGSRVYVGTQGGELLVFDARSGSIAATRKIAGKDLGVDHAGDDIVVASSEDAVFGLDPNTGVKQWEYPSNARAQKPLYFKGVVILQTSGTQIAALDALTGAVLWQYSGKLAQNSLFAQLFGADVPSVLLTDDSFFIVEQGGVKEYAIERGASQGITNKEALTELAGALLAKGDVPEASRFAATARAADPNFPPLRLLQARLAQARGDTVAARRELVTYADLAGRQSRSGQETVAELKRDHGLIWQTEVGKGVLEGSWLIEDQRLLSVEAVSGRDAQFVLVDTASGTVLWRQNAERVLDVTYNARSRQVLFVRGQHSDPKTVQLNAVDLGSGVRKELARLTSPVAINAVAIAYANDRIFVATAATDMAARKSVVRITGFNATSGTRLWEIPHDFSAVNFQDVIFPIGVFHPKKDYLAYSIGRDLWVIRAGDGTIHAQHHDGAFIAPHRSRTDVAADDMVYFVTMANEVVAYNLATRQVALRAPVPEVEPVWIEGSIGVRDGLMFGTDRGSVFALDVSPNGGTVNRVRWRVKVDRDQRFAWNFRSGDHAWAYRDDNVLLQLDRSTGQVLNEYPLLWVPVDVSLDGDRLYAFTADGQAYAMQLKATGK